MDYIIIKKDGNPLNFNDLEYTDSGNTIVVYGDEIECQRDFNNDNDLGIASLSYKVNGDTETTEVLFDNKKVGEFNSKFGDEADFQTKLLDFIILCDFVAYQLPH